MEGKITIENDIATDFCKIKNGQISLHKAPLFSVIYYEERNVEVRACAALVRSV